MKSLPEKRIAEGLKLLQLDDPKTREDLARLGQLNAGPPTRRTEGITTAHTSLDHSDEPNAELEPGS